MKLATVGSSWITESFISAAKTVEGIEIYAVYSRDKERAKSFAEKNGVPHYFYDLTQMAQCPQIDAVYIASPNKPHYEQSKLFLQNGKHCLCEKPATVTAEQSKELFELARQNGLIFAEAIMSIHTPAFEILKQAIKTIGNIRTVNLVYCQLSSKYGLFVDGKNPNIFNPALCAGCLMDIGVYNVYLAAALFHKPEKVTSHSVFLPNGCDAAGSAVFSYRGFDVNLCYSKVGQSYAPSEIIGDGGTIQIESVSQLTGIKLLTKQGEAQLVPSGLTRDEVMSKEAAFFLSEVNNATAPSPRYAFAQETALLVRELCEEIRKQNSFLF